MYTYDNKIAFITGAQGTIGKAYAKNLFENNIRGIALVDIQKQDDAYQHEHELVYGKNKCMFIQANVGNNTELKGAFETTVKHFGQLDIVINNAGIANEKDYNFMLNINFIAVANGTMMALHEYLPKYKTGLGVIVNTASVLGLFPTETMPMYSVSKHAVVAIGMCFEQYPDCLNNDIRVLTICPGPIHSNLLTKEEHDAILKSSPSNRKSVPVAESADFLGKGLIKIINEGNNGAVWMFVDNKNPTPVDYHPNQKLVMDYLHY